MLFHLFLTKSSLCLRKINSAKNPFGTIWAVWLKVFCRWPLLFNLNSQNSQKTNLSVHFSISILDILKDYLKLIINNWLFFLLIPRWTAVFIHFKLANGIIFSAAISMIKKPHLAHLFSTRSSTNKSVKNLCHAAHD